jgi:hypothetical protein
MKFLAALMAGALAAGMALPAAATLSTVGNVNVVATSNGLWLVSPTGRVSFCLRMKNAGSGTPVGQCSVLGNVAAAAAGWHFVPTDPDLFIINRSTGAITSCTMVTTPSAPRGGCIQQSTLAALN